MGSPAPLGAGILPEDLVGYMRATRVERLKTGSVIDDCLGGGLPAGITLLGGMPNSGKSTLLADTAMRAVTQGGMRVLYVTNDDPKHAIVAHCAAAWCSQAEQVRAGVARFPWSRLDERLDAELAELMRPDPLDGSVMDPSRAAYEAARRPGSVAAALNAFSAECAGRLEVRDDFVTTLELVAALEEARARGAEPQLVILDYFQQMQSGDPNADREEMSRAEAASEYLRAWGAATGGHAIVVSRVRKSSAKSEDEPTLADFAGNSKLAYDAQAAIILRKNPELDGKTATGAAYEAVEAYTVKSKVGRAGAMTQYKLFGGASTTRRWSSK